MSSSSPYQNTKGIIFDIDGTLADSWKLGFDATEVVLKNNNIPAITEETYHECTKFATPERLARHAGFEPGDERFESEGDRLAQEFDELYIGLVDTNTAGFFTGIQNALDGIPPNVKVGALTNACVAYAHAVFQVNSPSKLDNGKGSLYRQFVSIHGADTVPNPKPKPDGLFKVCQELGLAPEECVYVGDSPSDGLAASAAGMPSIAVLWGSHPEESLRKAPFQHFCSTPEELKELLPK